MILARGTWRLARPLVCLVVLLLAAAPAKGDDAPVAITGVEIGIDGHYKVGQWTPVRVTLDSAASDLRGRLVLIASDGDGLTTRFSDGVEHSLSGEQTLTGYVKFGSARGGLTVEVEGKQGALARRTLATTELPPGELSTGELLVVLGEDIGLREALPQRPYLVRRPTTVVTLPSPDQLPTHPLGWQAVDTFVLATRNVDWSRVSPAQLAALSDWLHLGGRAIITCGREGERLFGPDGLVPQLAPGKFERIAPLRRTVALEAYVGTPQRIETDGPRGASIDLTLLSDVRGRLEAYEGVAGGQMQPLIVQYPVGLGQVTLVTLDLDAPPLSTWSGRPRLVARLLGFHQTGETGKEQDRGAQLPAQLGYHDLGGQLRLALEQFPSVTLIPFSWIAALLVLYILLIGPGDFLLLRYGLGRMQATWLTLALAGIGFVALAAWVHAGFKSPQVHINQAEVIDVDGASGTVRGIAWSHVYSPTTQTFTLTPEVPIASSGSGSSPLTTSTTAIAWQGLPGTGLGGLDGRAAPNLFDLPYDVTLETSAGAPAASVAEVPIQTASTKAFVTDWWRPVPRHAEGDLRASADGLLAGSFVNTLEVELQDCLLMYQNWLYRIPGTLAPEETVDVEALRQPRNLAWHLTRKKVVESKDVITPYNPAATDTDRILEVMMFHKAAGGDSYSSLTNRYYARLDLSDHLRTGRAILVGRAARQTLELATDSSAGQPAGDDAPESSEDEREQSWTIYRLVLPVQGTLRGG